MKGVQKLIFVLSLSLSIASVFVFVFMPGRAHAAVAEFNVSNANNPLAQVNLAPIISNIGNPENILPGPVNDFINSAKQIGENVAYKTTSNLDIGTAITNPIGTAGDLYTRADNWFFETTGFHIREAFKGILNLFINILSLIVGALKWLLSLVS